MKIGFDLDKVFIDYPPFISSRLIDKLYKKRDNGILLYRIPNRPEQIFRRLTHLPPFRPPISGNLQFLKSIATEQNKLYLISSRFKFLEKPTNDLIKKHKLHKIFETMYFNYENKQPHEFKQEIIKNLHLDAYIDDDLSLLRHVASKNPKVKFYWLNQEIAGKKITKNIFAINHISDFLKQ